MFTKIQGIVEFPLIWYRFSLTHNNLIIKSQIMTEPWIIEQIEKIKRKKEEESRPRIEIPPPPVPQPKGDETPKENVIIIQL